MLSPYNYCINNPIKYVDPDGRDGMVTGSGTKEDPYVITAVYYYQNGSLDEDQVNALNNAVGAYNDLGGENGVKIKNDDGSKSYVKYSLSAEGVDNVDKAREDTQFETESGETRYYGNKVGTQPTEDNDESGSANNIRIDYNQPNMDAVSKEKGCNKTELLKGVMIHEIGHNIGGEHFDGTSTMRNALKTPITSQNSSGGENSAFMYSYPSTSTSFLKITFNRKDSKKSDPTDGRIWTKKK